MPQQFLFNDRVPFPGPLDDLFVCSSNTVFSRLDTPGVYLKLGGLFEPYIELK